MLYSVYQWIGWLYYACTHVHCRWYCTCICVVMKYIYISCYRNYVGEGHFACHCYSTINTHYTKGLKFWTIRSDLVFVIEFELPLASRLTCKSNTIHCISYMFKGSAIYYCIYMYICMLFHFFIFFFVVISFSSITWQITW